MKIKDFKPLVFTISFALILTSCALTNGGSDAKKAFKTLPKSISCKIDKLRNFKKNKSEIGSFPKQFTDGLFAVSAIPKFELIDKLVEIIIPVIYDSVNYFFSDKKSELKLDCRNFYIDVNAKEGISINNFS
jgi:hypothetical protein